MKSLIAGALFGIASIAGLLAQAEESVWTKSAWGIMCLSFLTAVSILFRMNQQLHKDRLADKDARIAEQAAHIDLLERQRDVHDAVEDSRA